MTVPRRTRLDPDARRAQLVELGVRALSKVSLYDINLDEIAAEGGISRSLLFHYFGSKRRFQLAVVQAAAAGLLHGTDPDPALPSARQLRASIEDSVDYVSSRRDLYLSLVRGAASGDAAMQEIFDRTRGALVDRIMDGIAELGGDSDDPLLPIAVRSWLAFTEEAIISWTPGGPVPRERLTEFLERAFYRAVLA